MMRRARCRRFDFLFFLSVYIFRSLFVEEKVQNFIEETIDFVRIRKFFGFC